MILQNFNKTKPIAFLGYGSLATQLQSQIKHNVKDFIIFDDLFPNAFKFDLFCNNILKYNWVISIGYKHLNKKLNILSVFHQHVNHNLLTLIHPTSYVSPHSNISYGVTIYPMCNIDTNVTLKPGVILHNSVIVSHDSIIGEGSYVSPGVIISGNVEIGESCFIGAGSIISNNISIGNNVVIGAGTLVTKNIPDNSNVIGNPMKMLNKTLNLI
jgi:UDP-N-acetylbacillosamine N-acetyltransferase